VFCVVPARDVGARFDMCCSSSLLQFSVAVLCCSTLLPYSVAVLCCSTLLHYSVAVLCCSTVLSSRFTLPAQSMFNDTLRLREKESGKYVMWNAGNRNCGLTDEPCPTNPEEIAWASDVDKKYQVSFCV